MNLDLDEERTVKRRLICQIGKRMYERRFIASYEGNLSMRLSNKNILITPSGFCKGRLQKDMIIETDLQGNILVNPENLEPSTEFGMHLTIYSKRKDVNSIIHAHPIHTVALSLKDFDFNKPVLPEVPLYCGKIGVCGFVQPGTDDVPKSIEPLIADHDTIILKRHGSVTLGEDLLGNMYRLEALEHANEIIWKAISIG